eukprot:4406027-Heterocapsa_arctica.AAC.1
MLWGGTSSWPLEVEEGVWRRGEVPSRARLVYGELLSGWASPLQGCAGEWKGDACTMARKATLNAKVSDIDKIQRAS